MPGSGAHSQQDLLTKSLTDAIIRGAGLDNTACHQLLITNPQALIKNLPYAWLRLI